MGAGGQARGKVQVGNGYMGAGGRKPAHYGPAYAGTSTAHYCLPAFYVLHSACKIRLPIYKL
ncbi:hypothetical protein GCM10023188_36510 [Pontibacter saemangeumensis]|uniref:Uncharacterized protein n=1 Tax=Pontibacter saemangeumensis TaxID=1084525 RepID=A0ABP8LYR3_9BACT